MKGLNKSFVMLVALLVFGFAPANAQFGNILKKVKKTVEAVAGTDTVNSTSDGSNNNSISVASVAIPGGGMMENPLSSVLDVELQGAYGVSTSQNYGTVYLVFKAKMIANKTKASFGGELGKGKSMAVDQDGNAYYMKTMGQYPYDLTEGLFVKVTLNNKDAHFADVKKTATTMQMIRLAVYIDPAHQGIVTFRNVPVKWDEDPK